MASLRAKVRERTDRRFVGLDVTTVAEGFEPGAAGLGQLLPPGALDREVGHVDRYVYRRPARFASVKHGLHGRN